MQKFGFLATTALVQGALAYRSYNMNNTPFVGEHADAQIIEGVGRTTHRARPIADKINKYDSIVSKDLNKEAYKAPETKFYEALFGASEPQPSRSRTSKRLGAQKVIIQNAKEDLFTSTFYMGGK